MDIQREREKERERVRQRERERENQERVHERNFENPELMRQFFVVLFW